MGRKSCVSSRAARARDGAIRTAIGCVLSAHYDVAEALPEHLQDLLKQLEGADESAAAEFQVISPPRAVNGTGAIRGRNWHPNDAL